MIKIISGGQWGADMGGLLAAEDFGLETGGTAPRDFMTERGTAPWLGTRFGLKEIEVVGLSLAAQYRRRAEFNVRDADVTFCFDLVNSKATANAEADCRKHRKLDRYRPVRLWRNPDTGKIQRDWRHQPPDEIADWLKAVDAKVVNVAGNRESKAKDIGEFVRGYFHEVFAAMGLKPR